jgi:hypothetical protein
VFGEVVMAATLAAGTCNGLDDVWTVGDDPGAFQEDTHRTGVVDLHLDRRPSHQHHPCDPRPLGR